jgi:inner membrane transporter RhtA
MPTPSERLGSPTRTMPKLSTSSTPPSTFLPVLALVAAMASLQLGASFAKSLFPLVGAQGTTALRLLFSAIALLCFFRPWRASLAPGAWRIITLYGSGPGRHEFFVLDGDSHHTLGHCGSVGICRPPIAVAVLASRRVVDFVWIALACA